VTGLDFGLGGSTTSAFLGISSSVNSINLVSALVSLLLIPNISLSFCTNEVKALTKYLSQELEKEVSGDVPLSTKHPEIYGIIEDAKANLREGNLNDAIRMIVRLDILTEKIKDATEKRSINYDIMELKTDLKLATLS